MSVFNNILAGAAGQGGGEEDELTIENSLRFNRSDSSYLSFTPSSTGDRKTWTLSFWLKRTSVGAEYIFAARNPLNDSLINIVIDGDDRFCVGHYSFTALRSYRQYRDLHGWYHLCLVIDTTASQNDRFQLFTNGIRETLFDVATYPNADTQYNVNTQSVHTFGQSGSDYGNFYLAEINFLDGHTPSTTTDTDGSVTGTAGAEYLTNFGKFSDDGVWIPTEYGGAYGTNGYRLSFSNGTSNSNLGLDSSGNNNHWTVHSLVALLNNNNSIISFNATGYAQVNPYTYFLDGDDSTGVGVVADGTHTTSIRTYRLGTAISNGTAEVLYANGNSQVTGHISIDGGHNYTTLGTYSSPTWINLGTMNSDYIDLKSTFNSGGGSTAWFYGFRVNGTQVIAAGEPSDIDRMVDSPSNKTASSGNNIGNYAVLSAIDTHGNVGTYSNGGLEFTKGSGYATAYSSLAMTSGKWYCEVIRGSGNTVLGITDETRSGDYLDRNSGGYGYRHDGTKVHNNQAHGNIGGYSSTDVVGLAFDADAKTIYFYKNGSLQGSFTNVTSTPPAGAWHFAFSAENTTIKVNFGQRGSFAHTPPTGYKALCTQNLPDADYAAVPNGSEYFKTILWNGDNSTSRTITTGIDPGLVWMKTRNNQGGDWSHRWFDRVRGVNGAISSNSQTAEENRFTMTCGGISAFSNTGFTLSQSGGNVPCANANGNSMVAWVFNAGSSTVTNTSGSISASVRASQTAGFSIIKWTGTGSNGSIGHGLNGKPQLVVTKNLADSSNWVVDVIGVTSSGTDYLLLNNTGNKGSGGSTADSSVVNVLGYNDRNGSSDEMIAYCWREIPGFSRIGVYQATSNDNGRVVWCGFRPRFIMVKNIDDTQYQTAYNWTIFDTARKPYNKLTSSTTTIDHNPLYANSSADENTYTYGGASTGLKIDTLSTGFKLKSGSAEINHGGTYVFLALAEHPSKFARAF